MAIHGFQGRIASASRCRRDRRTAAPDGLRAGGARDGTTRFPHPGTGTADVIDIETPPGTAEASSGPAQVHHIAFAVQDRAAQGACAGAASRRAIRVTPVIDATGSVGSFSHPRAASCSETQHQRAGRGSRQDSAHLGEALEAARQYRASALRLRTHLEPPVAPRPMRTSAAGQPAAPCWCCCRDRWDRDQFCPLGRQLMPRPRCLRGEDVSGAWRSALLPPLGRGRLRHGGPGARRTDGGLRGDWRSPPPGLRVGGSFIPGEHPGEHALRPPGPVRPVVLMHPRSPGRSRRRPSGAGAGSPPGSTTRSARWPRPRRSRPVPRAGAAVSSRGIRGGQ